MTHRSAVAYWLCSCSLAAAAEPVPTPQVIQQLASAEFRTRESAAKLLEARGEAALPELRLAQPHPDPEVRKRLDEIIAGIERSALLAPRLVTLHMEDAPVADVIAELSRQTDYRLVCPGGTPGQLVTIHTDDEPFWNVLDRICVQAGLALQPHHDGNGGLMLYRQNTYSPYVHYHGAFRIAAVNFHYYKQMNFGAIPTQNPFHRQRHETLTFAFNVTAEPKVPLLGLGQPQVLVVTDERGRSILPDQIRNPYAANYPSQFGYRNMMLQTQVQLGSPGEARSIARLQAVVPVTVLAEQKPEITIDRIAEVKEYKAEGQQVSIEIHEVREAPNRGFHVTATAKRVGANNMHDYTWTSSLHQRIELQDAEGRKYHSQGFNWDTGTPNSVRGTFMFIDPAQVNGQNNNPQLGKPYRLIFYSWTTALHQLEFEFRDLPLP